MEVLKRVLIVFAVLMLVRLAFVWAGRVSDPHTEGRTFVEYVNSGHYIDCLWAGPDNLCGTPDDGEVRWIWEAKR